MKLLRFAKGLEPVAAINPKKILQIIKQDRPKGMGKYELVISLSESIVLRLLFASPEDRDYAFNDVCNLVEDDEKEIKLHNVYDVVWY